MYNIDAPEIETKFYDLCRLCASYDNVKISVFSEEGKRRQLRKKIQSFLPFKIEENDCLPKSLCYKCVYNLETTYEFRHKCIQVHRDLEKQLHKKEREIQSNTVAVGCSPANKIHPEVSIFAIPSLHDTSKINEETDATPSETERDGSPNPLDFLEVGVNAEENSVIRSKRNLQENKKSYAWKADKRWLSIEHKPLHNDSVNDSKGNTKYSDWTQSQDENGSRRKSCNPRKIARENEGNDETEACPPTPDLIAISAYGSSKNFNNTVCDSGSAVFDDCCNENDNVDEDEDETDLSVQQIFTCLLCEKNFGLRSSLDKHFSSTHGIEPYEVTSRTTTANVDANTNTHTHTNTNANTNANANANTNANANANTNNATAALLVSQSLVERLADERKEDEEEELESMMEQETVIFCQVCRREFQDRASLWLHMVHAHREEASVSCGICLKICCDNITLIEHVNTAHSADKAVVQRRYSCQVCGRQHDSRQKLLKHATLHTLIDNQGQTIQPEEMVSLNNAFAPRECAICRKKFFNEEKLNHHTLNFHNDANENTLSISLTSPSPSALYKCELCASAHATRMDRWWHMYHSHSGDTRVTCERDGCRKVFVSPALKDEHFKTHHEAQGDFTNTCEICGKLWESRTVFYKHMMNVHAKCLPTICGVCTKIFSNVPELRAHVRDDHPQRTLIEQSTAVCCDICGRPYAERSKMLRHRRVHNVTDGVPSAVGTVKKKDDLVCAFCPHLCFDKYEHVAEHRRSVHQLFVCDLCPKFYNGNNHLWKHVSKQHKGDPNVTCNLCLRTSASRAHLERHKLKYHSDPLDKLVHKQATAAATVTSVSHKCNLCGKIFRIRSLLKKHLKSCKGAKPIVAKVEPVNGVYPCAKCNKVFEFQNLLYKHTKNSHVQYTCEVCPLSSSSSSSFDTKKDLLGHIREQHSNHCELACDVVGCGKVLRLKADLKKHKLEHARGYFTYICEICGDMFSNRKKLRKHLQTYHKGDVKFLCAVCVAIHQSVHELTAHVHSMHPFVLHRPYTCQICGKCWSVSSKVVEHISKAHGREYRPCKICWKVFTDERIFEQHVNHHPPVDEKSTASASASTTTTTTTAAASLESHDTSPQSSTVDNSVRYAATKAVGLSHELSTLGVTFKTGGSLKRSLENDSLSDEEANDGGGGGGGGGNDSSGSKRLRRKYRCVRCKETFRSADELNEHQESSHAATGQSVDELPPSSEMLSGGAGGAYEKKHESNKFERWTSVRPIACDCCDKIWNSKKQLWQHLIRSHANESQHACGICLRVCRDYFDLFYHLDSQHSTIVNDHTTNRFSCFVCGHYHNSQSKLDKHFSLHKNAPARCEYSCQHCRTVFKSVAYYREHIRQHQIAPAEPKAKPLPEFSGFSINHILATKSDRRRNAILTTDDQNNERSTAYFDEGAYDVKYKEKMEYGDDEEDLVEELDESENSDLAANGQSSDEHDGNTFKGYDTCPSPPKYPTTVTPQMATTLPSQNRQTIDTTILSSDCNMLVDNTASASVLNGGIDSAHVTRPTLSFSTNNNQMQRVKLESDVTSFS